MQEAPLPQVGEEQIPLGELRHRTAASRRQRRDSALDLSPHVLPGTKVLHDAHSPQVVLVRVEPSVRRHHPDVPHSAAVGQPLPGPGIETPRSWRCRIGRRAGLRLGGVGHENAAVLGQGSVQAPELALPEFRGRGDPESRSFPLAYRREQGITSPVRGSDPPGGDAQQHGRIRVGQAHALGDRRHVPRDGPVLLPGVRAL